MDAQSFPMDSPSAPQLVQGAYSSSLTYSMAELQEVVQFGADRGVRVLLVRFPSVSLFLLLFLVFLKIILTYKGN